MPIFEYNGKKVNVSEEQMGKFAEINPDATTILADKDNKKYRVKASDYNTFQKEILGIELPSPIIEQPQSQQPQAADTVPQPTPQSAGNFTKPENPLTATSKYDTPFEGGDILERAMRGSRQAHNIGKPQTSTYADQPGYDFVEDEAYTEPVETPQPTAQQQQEQPKEQPQGQQDQEDNQVEEQPGEIKEETTVEETVEQPSADGKPFQPSVEDRLKFAQTVAHGNAMMDYMAEKNKNIRDYALKGGDGKNVVKGKPKINPETNRLEEVYITAEGDTFNSSDEANARSAVAQAQQKIFDKEDTTILDAVNKAIQSDKDKSKEAVANYAKNPINMIGSGLGGNYMGIASAQQSAGSGDFSNIVDTAIDKLPVAYKETLRNNYLEYFRTHPEDAKDKTAEQAADEALRATVEAEVFGAMVKDATPKSKTEFFVRKLADQNLILNLLAGATQDKYSNLANMMAMEGYGQDHKFLNLSGVILGMALDPTTYISGGIGGQAAKWTTRAVSRAIMKDVGGKIATRAVGTRFVPRLVGGIAGGSGNFATFEGLKDLENQLYLGGKYDPETGNIGDYSLLSILNSGVHGLIMGGATGGAGATVGNVADKMVKASAGTADKVIIRTGQTVGSTLLDGTIFSIPEWIEGQRPAMDVWEDNVAMMIGFKVSHGIKSVPQVIGELRVERGPRGVMSFEEKLRERLDRSPSDLSFSKEELEELRLKGYGDFGRLFNKEFHPENETVFIQTDDGRWIARDQKVARQAERQSDNKNGWGIDGYDMMQKLMEDDNVSQAVRAKAYYALTERTLPVSTVTGYTTFTNGDGTTWVNSTAADGSVITSRKFDSREKALGEIQKIRRQVELNTVEVGERFYDATNSFGSKKLREDIKKEKGIDIDEVLRKRHDKRSGEENETLAEYIQTLYPEEARNINNETRSAEESPEAKEMKLIGDNINQSYDEGYDAEDANTMADSRSRLDVLEGELPENLRRKIDMDPIGTITAIDDPALKQKAMDYANIKATVEGMQQRVQDDIDSQIEASNNDIDKQTNRTTGMVQMATLNDGRKVYVITGEVVPFADGTGIDMEHSDKSPIVVDAESGELRMAAVEEFVSIDETVDPSTRKEAAANEIRSRVEQESADKQNGTLTFQPGEKVTIINDDGEPLELEIIGPDNEEPDEVVVVRYPSGTTGKWTMRGLQEESDAARMAGIRAEMAAAETPAEQPTETPAEREETSGTSHQTPEENEVPIEGEESPETQNALGRNLNEEESTHILSQMEGRAEVAPDLELSIENWDNAFPDGKITTPIGEVKMGENQYTKLIRYKRSSYFGMIAPTLTNPDVIIEKYAPEEGAERDSKYLFVKSFVKPDGSRVIHFESVTVQRDGMEVSISSHEAEAKDIKKEMQNGKILHLSDKLSSGSEGYLTGTPEKEGSDLFPTSDNNISSENKDNSSLSTEQTNNAESSALARIPKNEKGEMQFERAEPRDAWTAMVEMSEGNEDAVTENVKAVIESTQKELDTLRKKGPKTVKPKLGGNPVANMQAQKEAAQQNANNQAAWEQNVQTLENKLAAWQRIESQRNAISTERRIAERERLRQEQERATDESQARFEQQQAEQQQKEAEMKAVGPYNMHPKIKEKYDSAPKQYGYEEEYTLPDGTPIKGRWVLTESGAVTPSHDPFNNFASSDGFAMDERGQNVNDRDYAGDKDASENVQKTAAAYDNRALQTPVFISKEGAVYSGNGREMAGQLAATNGTDGAYVDYLKRYSGKFGFKTEDVEKFKNPRAYFEVAEDLPYNAQTFSRFNQSEMKSQSKTEEAVKLGKTVSNDIFGVITHRIGGFDTLSDFYRDNTAVNEVLGLLRDAGVIQEVDLPKYRNGEELSTAGKDLIENALIGKAFEGNPDAVRQVMGNSTLRQSVIMGLGEIVHNRRLRDSGFDLGDELARAIKLAYDARKSNPDAYREGAPVSEFGLQLGLFGDQSVTDATVLLLADILNSSRPSELRKILSLYNKQASESAKGQIDMFSGEVPTKESILKQVNELFRNATRKEQRQAERDAIESRKQQSEESRKAADTTQGERAAEGGRREESTGRRATDPIPELNWSEEKALNGEPFLVNEKGETDLVEIPKVIFDRLGMESIPFRLTPSMINHVLTQHAKELKISSPQKAVDAILNVMRNFDHVRRDENGDIIFSIEEGRDRVALRTITLVLENNNGQWLGVKTTGHDRLKNLNKAESVWDKREIQTHPTGAEPANVSPARPSEIGSAEGITSSHTKPSEGKDNVPSVKKQVGGEESSPRSELSRPESNEEGKIKNSSRSDANSLRTPISDSNGVNSAGKDNALSIKKQEDSEEGSQEIPKDETKSEEKPKNEFVEKVNSLIGEISKVEEQREAEIDKIRWTNEDTPERNKEIKEKYDALNADRRQKVADALANASRRELTEILSEPNMTELLKRVLPMYEGHSDWDAIHNRLKNIKLSEMLREAYEGAENLPQAPAGTKPKKVNLQDYAAGKDGDKRMSGVYHHEGLGMAVSSDTHILIGDRRTYDPKQKGKTVDKKGNVVHEDGTESHTRYPAVERVLPKSEPMVTVSLSRTKMDELSSSIRHALKGLDKNDAQDAQITVRFPDGNMEVFNAQNLAKFLEGVNALEGRQIEFRGAGRPIFFRGENGVVLLMPADGSKSRWRIDFTDPKSGTSINERRNDESFEDHMTRVAQQEKERHDREKSPFSQSLQQQLNEINSNPTDAQKEAGNYRKGHVKIDGHDVTIENPKGSVRRGTDSDGKSWETTMRNTYGYIRGTKGVDGDQIDVFFSDTPEQGDVFVVDQINPKDGSFDEHKVMYGFPDIESAREAYLSNYSEGWQGLGNITRISRDDFKKWIESSTRKTKPFAEYKSVKKVENAQNIEDFGEEIHGARKDALKEVARNVENVTVKSLIELPMSKAFKRPDLKKLVDNGVISNEEAIMAEAVMQTLVYGTKKPTLTKKLSSKRNIEKWANETFEGVRLLGEILSGDPQRRAAALEQHRQRLESEADKMNAYIQKLREWNPEKTFDDVTPEKIVDPVMVMTEVLNRLGWRPGEKIELPLPNVELTRDGKNYEIFSAGKQGAYWFGRYHSTLEDAINTMVKAAKLKRGDMDVELGDRQFGTKGVGARHEVETGRFVVDYVGPKGNFDFREKTFSSEEEAKKFAEGKNARIRPEKKFTNEYDRYQLTATNPLTGERYGIGPEFASRTEAAMWLEENLEEANRLALEEFYKEMGQKGREREHFYVSSLYTGKEKGFVYAVIEDDKNNPWPIVMEFTTRKEAQTWFAENKDRLENELNERLKAEREIVWFNTGNRERIGEDYRQGRESTPEMYDDAFGFRGVQFGNWTNPADRRMAMDQAYDAFMDLAQLLGLSSKAMGLDGELGLAFGARGSGKALAHYEPVEVVINLTKTKGAGSLAHEWLHALDNFLSRKGGVSLGYATHGNGRDAMRPEVQKAVDNLIEAIMKSEYGKRSMSMRSEYWGRPTEMTARLFETWVSESLKREGKDNPFLARGLNDNTLKKFQDWNYLLYQRNERRLAEREGRSPRYMSQEEFNKTPESLNGYPYPTPDEVKAFEPYLRELFEVLSGRESETGSMAMEDGVDYGKIGGENGVVEDRVKGYKKSKTSMAGRSLFDFEGDHKAEKTPEEKQQQEAATAANRSIDEYSEAFYNFNRDAEEIEEHLRDTSLTEEERTELEEELQRMEDMIIEHRERLQRDLEEYYAMNNTPEDARRLSRDMAMRVQAEVSMRMNQRRMLDDILYTAPMQETPEPTTSEVAVKTAGGETVYHAYGTMPDAEKGEFAYAERIFTLTGDYNFTGKDVVKDRGDVAFIFRSLQDYSIENSFAVLEKNGEVKIIRLGVGMIAATQVDASALRAAYNTFGADKIYFVHNHPSGNLLRSDADMKLTSMLARAFEGEVKIEALVIDTTSGRFAHFKPGGEMHEEQMKADEGNSRPLEVMKFDQAQQLDGQREDLEVIRNSRLIVDVVNKLRANGGKGFLILNHSNKVIGNFCLDFKNIGDDKVLNEVVDQMVNAALKFNGNRVVLYGKFDKLNLVANASSIQDLVDKKSGSTVKLLDAIDMISDKSYDSAYDNGWIGENAEGYEDFKNEGLLFRFAEDKEDFDAMREQAIAEKGIVMPGLAEKEVEVVKVPRHDFEGTGKEALKQADEWAKKNIVGEHKLIDSQGKEIDYTISNKAIEKYLSSSATSKSENIGVHLSVLKQLPEVIENSIEAEVHPDYPKGKEGARNNTMEPSVDVLIHRLYGAVEIDGALYRVKTTIQEREGQNNLPHSYEVVEIKMFGESPNISMASKGRIDNNSSLERTNVDTNPEVRKIPGKELLKGVEKSYDEGMMLLDASNPENYNREGTGAYSDAEVSMENDPISKVWGKSLRTPAEQRQFAERERTHMKDRVEEMAKKLNVGDEVEIVTSTEGLEGRQKKAKGFFNPATGKITIVVPNHATVEDAEKTFLHETVTHYGLRKLFGKKFNDFIKNVYEMAEQGVRKAIDELASRKGLSRETATEEYMAGLAEDINFEKPETQSWWRNVKKAFLDFLKNIFGIKIDLSDNELRYILWSSYENLKGKGNDIWAMAERAVKRDKKERDLKVGHYEEAQPSRGNVAEESDGDVEQINKRFNDELNQFKDGILQKGHRFTLGNPSLELQSTGIPDLPIILPSSVIAEKSRLDRHPYTYDELKNLPLALRNPIAIFKYGDGNKGQNLVVHIEHEGKNFIVGLFIRPTVKGRQLEINSIRNVFPKNNHEWINWINQGKLLRLGDKKAIQTIIDKLRMNPVAFDYVDLENATKIIEEFENPKLPKNDIAGEPDGAKLERINKLRKSEPVVIADETIPEGIDLKDRSTVQKELLRTIRDTYENKDTGEKIEVTKKGIEEATHHGMNNEAHVKSLFAIPSMLENSIFIDERPNTKNNGKYDSYRYYVCGLKIDGEDYTAKIVVGVKRGKFYYDHHLSHIEKGSLIDNVNGVDKTSIGTSDGRFSNAVGSSKDKGMTLERLLQINDGENNSVSEPDILFRDGDDETADLGNGMLPLSQRIANAKLNMLEKNRNNREAKDEAAKAVDKTLRGIRNAMRSQKVYDKSTVKQLTGLVQKLYDTGMLRDATDGELSRLLSAIKNGTTENSVEKSVDKVFDILIGNQLRNAEQRIDNISKLNSSRVNAAGVEVQGALDARGQYILKVFNQTKDLESESYDSRGELKTNSIRAKMLDAADRMASDDDAVSRNAAVEYEALQLADLYSTAISDSKAEEAELKSEIETARAAKKSGTMSAEDYRQFVKATEEAIMENRIDRIESLNQIADRLGEIIIGSVEKAADFRQRERQRIENIHHLANSDMQGRPTNEHRKDTRSQKIVNSAWFRFFFKPLATFDHMLRMFGNKSVDGEGYLYDHFMKNGWVKAAENKEKGKREATDELDRKVSQVFGKRMRWSDLYSIERSMPKMKVSFWDGGEIRDHELTQGNMLYIYMADKMADGRMKLRRMGIDEDQIEAIKEKLDPKFIKLADWLQEDFLVKTRNKYNEVYERMFGVPMAAIENYFPMRINSNARTIEVDVSNPINDDTLPSTVTGSIIKRRRNSLPLDVTNADAFSVVIEHLQEMEKWAAFAEFNRDLNTLLSYKRFRNQVKNMSSIYGGGETLWNEFRNVARIAAGTYQAAGDKTIDKAALNLAKGVTMAKISGRVYTALKQLLSFPAYFSEASPIYLAKAAANPVKSWNWCMENLPLFKKRWTTRQAGDNRLMKTDVDWRFWKNRIVETASRWGMSPNAFVDAVTVSIGAHAIYQTKYQKYRKEGFSHDEADSRAKKDATISYNQTQQSNESAFLSAMQLDRTTTSVALTVFRNASMGYQRREVDAFRNLARRMSRKNYKEESIAFMTKKLEREGLSHDQAEKAAKKRFKRQVFKDLANIAIFGYVMQISWNLGPYLVYIFAGDDDDQKDDMMKDAARHALFGSVEGLTGGSVMSEAANMIASGESLQQYDPTLLPVLSDIKAAYRHFDTDVVVGANDIVNLIVQMGIGVNPQTITDAAVAIYDGCAGDIETSREATFMLMRILQVPQSQLDKIFIDELNMTAREARSLEVKQLAERYARYKAMRATPLTGWMYDDEGKQTAQQRWMKRYEKDAKGAVMHRFDPELEDKLDAFRQEAKETSKVFKKVKSKNYKNYEDSLQAIGEFEASPENYRRRIIESLDRQLNKLSKRWLEAETEEEIEAIEREMDGRMRNALEQLEADPSQRRQPRPKREAREKRPLREAG